MCRLCSVCANAREVSFLFQRLHYTCCDGGAENAGVENAGAITYGKPKFEKCLTVFTASNLKTIAKVHNYLLRRV